MPIFLGNGMIAKHTISCEDTIIRKINRRVSGNLAVLLQLLFVSLSSFAHDFRFDFRLLADPHNH